MNGGGQLGAVTRAYNRQRIIVKIVLSSPLAHMRGAPPIGGSGGMLHHKILGY